MRRSCSRVASGMAMIASSAGVVFSSSVTASRGPSTGIPERRRPIFCGSSSRKATTRPKIGLAWISRARARPVRPAPMM